MFFHPTQSKSFPLSPNRVWAISSPSNKGMFISGGWRKRCRPWRAGVGSTTRVQQPFFLLFASCSGMFHCNIVSLQLQILYAEESLTLLDILIIVNKTTFINLENSLVSVCILILCAGQWLSLTFILRATNWLTVYGVIAALCNKWEGLWPWVDADIIVTTNTTVLATTITAFWFIKLQIGLKTKCFKSMLQELTSI